MIGHHGFVETISGSGGEAGEQRGLRGRRQQGVREKDRVFESLNFFQKA